MMKRTSVLGAIVLVGALSATVAALQQPAGRQGGARGAVPFGQETPSAEALMVEKVRNNLFVLRGGGGNTAVFVTAGGVVLVDTKLPGWGQPLIQKVKTLTDKPVTTIVNTHAHFDHASGNVEFPATVEIVTHQNTKTYMEQANPVSGVQQAIGVGAGGDHSCAPTQSGAVACWGANDRGQLGNDSLVGSSTAVLVKAFP
jgi:glyoxylase-like metal-dependent hydrolase (beta-lactamase superfamily II)